MSNNERDSVIEKFYVENYKKLVKRVYGRTRDVNLAEDIVQEAFARALKYYDKPDNFEFWFNTILENARKAYMNAERRSGCVDSVELEEEHLVIDESEWADDMMKRLEAEIAAVPDESYRNLLYLVFVRGFKPREALEVVDVNTVNVRMVIKRFKDDFTRKYGEKS